MHRIAKGSSSNRRTLSWVARGSSWYSAGIKQSAPSASRMIRSGQKKNRWRPLAPEGVVGGFGAGRMNGPQASWQRLPGTVADVRLFIHRPTPFGRVDFDTVGASIAPSRTLVTGSGETDGDNRLQLSERLRAKRQRIDQHGAIVATDGMRVAFRADALVEDVPAPETRHDLLDCFGHRLWFAHGPC